MNIMEKNEFIAICKCFSDSQGNPCAKSGSDPEKAFLDAEYIFFTEQVPVEAIALKYKQYIAQCIANKDEDKYICSMEGFIAKKKYKADYGASMKSKQASFLDKYGDKPKEPVIENPNAGMTEWLKSLPEGEFSMAEGDGEKEREIFLSFLQRNKRLFFEEYHFVIKQKDKDFIKIKI